MGSRGGTGQIPGIRNGHDEPKVYKIEVHGENRLSGSMFANVAK
jgi:hypothetical protein